MPYVNYTSFVTNEPVEETEKFISFHIENEQGEIITKYRIEDTIVLVIRTKNKKGKRFTINLSDQNADFEYNGKRLENDTLEYTIQDETERIQLKVINEKESEWKTE